MKRAVFFILVSLFLGGWVASWANAPQTRLVDFQYEVTVEDIPAGAQELKIWLPHLPETPYQEVQEVAIEPRESANISYDKTYHNKILNYVIAAPRGPALKFNVRYRVKRSEYSKKNAPSGALLETEDPRHHLQAGRLLTIGPEVEATAKEIVRGKTATMDKARAIYDYVFQNVSYDKTVPGWGNGDTRRVCLLKSGNCTDFHSLFISLARASGIPAKFVMGVPLSGDKKEGVISGYHCWAEFHDEQAGWVPVDISEAWEDKSKYEYYFGAIGADRLEISTGRDIVLEPRANTEPLNYFLYPYAEVDGKPFNQIKTSFRFQDVNTRKEVSKL
jgi:transglutaminase-like putative cysteine protease